MLYTRNGSYPAALPDAITLSNGFIRTDPASFTTEEIADAGYAQAPAQPSYDPQTERLEWDGEEWQVATLPPPPFPELTGRQVLLGLLSIDITEGDIDAVIDLIEDPAERRYAQIEWKKALLLKRHHPLVDSLALAFSLPSEQVDALWRWAGGL